MIDVGQVAAVVGSLKTASDIASALIGVRDQRLIDAKVAELLGVLLSAYDRAFTAQANEQAMVQRVRTLEAEISRMKEWDAGKRTYRLQAVGSGAFAYVYQPDADSEEPPHWLCVGCYNNRQKSLFQVKGRTKDNRSNIWACPSCNSEIIVTWSVSPATLAAHHATQAE